MFALGAICAGDHGVPANPAVAQSCLRKAAELGRGCAQLTLARHLSEGLAGEHNEAEARMWLEKAADQGGRGAVRID
jgi:TPR repeat protein